MNLSCPNCKCEVEQKDVKWFGGGVTNQAAIFLCPACHKIAEHLSNRGKKMLRDLERMLDEGIRVSACEGRLALPQGPDGEPTKKQLLEAILELKDLSDARKAQK